MPREAPRRPRVAASVPPVPRSRFRPSRGACPALFGLSASPAPSQPPRHHPPWSGHHDAPPRLSLWITPAYQVASSLRPCAPRSAVAGSRWLAGWLLLVSPWSWASVSCVPGGAWFLRGVCVFRGGVCLPWSWAWCPGWRVPWAVLPLSPHDRSRPQLPDQRCEHVAWPIIKLRLSWVFRLPACRTLRRRAALGRRSPPRTCGAARSARRPVKPEVAGSNPVRSASRRGERLRTPFGGG